MSTGMQNETGSDVAPDRETLEKELKTVVAVRASMIGLLVVFDIALIVCAVVGVKMMIIVPLAFVSVPLAFSFVQATSKISKLKAQIAKLE